MTQPTLTAFLPNPAIANGTAVIVCPGGAFHFLAYEHEGTQVAAWLNSRGIAAFLLKYRLIPTSDDFETEALMPPANFRVIRNVAQPTLTAYFPKPTETNGTAVIVCPGGGFHFLSIDYEGTDVAAWLIARGMTAFVLKYRLLRTGDDFATEVWRNLGDPQRMAELMKPLRQLLLADGQQAVRLVRQGAAEWGIHSDRIGIMGFSAGGAVTMHGHASTTMRAAGPTSRRRSTPQTWARSLCRPMHRRSSSFMR